MGKRYYWDRDRQRWADKPPRNHVHGVTVIDREKAMGDGVKCMADGKHYRNRREYEDTVKAHGMVIMGNDVVEQREYEPSSAIPDLLRVWEQLENG